MEVAPTPAQLLPFLLLSAPSTGPRVTFLGPLLGVAQRTRGPEVLLEGPSAREWPPRRVHSAASVHRESWACAPPNAKPWSLPVRGAAQSPSTGAGEVARGPPLFLFAVHLPAEEQTAMVSACVTAPPPGFGPSDKLARRWRTKMTRGRRRWHPGAAPGRRRSLRAGNPFGSYAPTAEQLCLPREVSGMIPSLLHRNSDAGFADTTQARILRPWFPHAV